MSQFHLAENLTQLRHNKRITQEKLADFLGVSKASVSKWETGQSLPDIAQLPRLAVFYDVSIDALMGYEPQLSMTEIKEYSVRIIPCSII
ncbi:MAG: helix-turn-helix transcriptional regulator [Agathobacter sp.]|nr:helix-turn-helix transcriptional regulator [Agathobacter sp.]